MMERDKPLNQTPAATEWQQESESAKPEGKPWHQPQLKILDARQTMNGILTFDDGPGYS